MDQRCKVGQDLAGWVSSVVNAALTVPRRALALTAQVFKPVESQLAGGQGEGKGLETIDKLDFISTL